MKTRQQQIIEDAPLGIIFKDDSQLFNPLESIPDFMNMQPEIFYTWVLSRPEYFWLTCKVLLGVDIHMMQGVILQNLWTHKFPMLVGSRGMGKSFILAVYALLRIILLRNRKVIICGSGFRQSKIIFQYMENIVQNSSILRNIITPDDISHGNDGHKMSCGNSFAMAIPIGTGDKIRGLRANDVIGDEFACLKAGTLVETNNGLIRIEDFESARNSMMITGDKNIEFESPNKFIKTPITDVYEVKMSNGYVIRCSKNHKLMTSNGWKNVLDINNGEWIEKSSNTIFGKSTKIDKDTAILLGILLSEGHVNHKSRLSVTTTDIKLAIYLHKKGWKIKKKPSYINKRGWKCKKSYICYIYDKELRDKLYDLGLDYTTAHNKIIPKEILISPKEIIESFLSGLFDGDGSCFLWKDRKIDNRIGLAYYSVSERLCRDVQVLMYKLGYDGYINKRKSKISDNWQWFVRWNNKDAFSAAKTFNIYRFNKVISKCIITDEPSHIYFDKSRNKWKISFVYLGKTIQKRFNTLDEAELYICYLKSLIQYREVLSVTKLDNQEHLYDYYLPATHSFYADGHRQHNSIPVEIFETVIQGFAAVSASPVEQANRMAKKKAAKILGFEFEDDKELVIGNQIIISGTAFYSFNHFSNYHEKYLKYIKSRGDERKILELVGDDYKNFDWRDYCIIRVPVDMLPEGFMDAAQVARARATVNSGIYEMEYGSVFSSDSNGFFKRTLIEGCVVKDGQDIIQPNGTVMPSHEVMFECKLSGDKGKTYILGCDPAMTQDNFSIVILEIDNMCRKIVYCWTTNKDDHKNKLKLGLVTENNYFSYCARKIRGLMLRFSISFLSIDTAGGGRTVMESLNDKNLLRPGEVELWPIVDPTKPKDTDFFDGMHIIDPIVFSREDWTTQSNHGLKKDMEDRVLLFPFFDAVSFADAEFKNFNTDNEDTVERCVEEIEELKNELSTISVSQTVTTNRERWDTPEFKLPNGKKGRMRKDRYSALLMANMTARTIQREYQYNIETCIGGFAQGYKKKDGDERQMFTGNPVIANKLSGLYDGLV